MRGGPRSMTTSSVDLPSVDPPCSAPDSALYFRPDGIVAACCASWHVLGRVDGYPRESLAEIWQGARARTLRRAVAERDWGFGCWECGHHIDAGTRHQSLAADFDDVAQSAGTPYPRMMDFALSNSCNLQCVMCNGGLSSAIRRHREQRAPLPTVYDDRFFEELEEFLPHLQRASFKGGEPFLGRENRRIWDVMVRDDIDCDVAVTTNGTILNDRVRTYLRDLRMSVNVSVDAVDHDLLRAIRVGVDPAVLWRNIDEIRSITAEVGSTFTMSFCLMSTNWHELPRFLAEARRRDATPNVIWVDGPQHHGIFSLQSMDLRRAADALRSGADATALGEGDRSLLLGAANRLEAAVAPDGSIGTVSVGLPQRLSPRHGTDVAAPVRRTADPSMRLVLREGVIRSVEAPDWADWLEPDRWSGIGLEELMSTISSRSGGPMRATMSTMAGGAHRAMVEFPEQPDLPGLEIVYVPSDHGASVVTVTPRDRSDESPT